MRLREACFRQLRSFACAGRGVIWMLKTQGHARFHALATVAAIGLGVWQGLRRLEWAVLLLAIAGVWVAEGLNTALEALADVCHPEWHVLIGRAKDVAAGAVLLAAMAAAAVGAFLFLG